MTYETRKVERIEDVVTIGTSLTGCWFRGHSRKYGNLTPSVFRKDLLDGSLIPKDTTRPDLPDYVRNPIRMVEAHFSQGFTLKAPSVTTDFSNGMLDRLFLMQHHGTPTRLLDWTENILVALYFSVHKNPEDDAELWAMAPVALSRCMGFNMIPSLENFALNYLVAEVWLDDAALEEMFRGLIQIPSVPLPMIPPMSFRRMVAQTSVFTIHPPPPRGKVIESLLKSPEHLEPIRITRQRIVA